MKLSTKYKVAKVIMEIFDGLGIVILLTGAGMENNLTDYYFEIWASGAAPAIGFIRILR